MDPAAISTTLATIVDSYDPIRENLSTASEISSLSPAHRDQLTQVYLAADDLGDSVSLLFTAIAFNQEAIKEANIDLETGIFITRFVEVITNVVASVRDLGEAFYELNEIEDVDPESLAAVIDKNAESTAQLIETCELTALSMDVLLALFQVWIDISYKATDKVLALSLAVLADTIDSLSSATTPANKDTETDTAPATPPLITLAKSIYTTLSQSHPTASNLSLATPVEITPAARPLLHTNICTGTIAAVREFLDLGISPHAPGPLGVAYLATASVFGQIEIIRLLLSRGADVNAKSGVNGETALMGAAVGGHLDVVRLLVQEGADVDAVSDKHGITALMGACEHGHLGIVEYLLLEGKADSGLVDWQGVSAVGRAVVNKRGDVVRFLEEYGVQEDEGLGDAEELSVRELKEAGNKGVARVVTRDGELRLVHKKVGEEDVEVLAVRMRRARLEEEEEGSE